MGYFEGKTALESLQIILGDELEKIAECADDQIVCFGEIDRHGGGIYYSVRTNAKELKRALANPYWKEKISCPLVKIEDKEYVIANSDYHFLDLLSPEQLAEVLAQEKVDKEISELEAAGINGPFYHHYTDCGFPDREFLASPDDIIELAEKIKAFRARKEKSVKG